MKNTPLPSIVSRTHDITVGIMKGRRDIDELMEQLGKLFDSSTEEKLQLYRQSRFYCRRQERVYSLAVMRPNLKKLMGAISRRFWSQLPIQFRRDTFYETVIMIAMRVEERKIEVEDAVVQIERLVGDL